MRRRSHDREPPLQRDPIAVVIQAPDLAIATSGAYEAMMILSGGRVLPTDGFPVGP
jgi:thiamine biosynthesis lipoprotein ApbE